MMARHARWSFLIHQLGETRLRNVVYAASLRAGNLAGQDHRPVCIFFFMHIDSFVPSFGFYVFPFRAALVRLNRVSHLGLFPASVDVFVQFSSRIFFLRTPRAPPWLACPCPVFFLFSGFSCF